MTEDEVNFQKFFPKVTELTQVKAAQEYGLGNEIVSLDGSPAGLDSFILQLASDIKVHGPFLMNAKCARELCARLVGAGFGPQ